MFFFGLLRDYNALSCGFRRFLCSVILFPNVLERYVVCCFIPMEIKYFVQLALLCTVPELIYSLLSRCCIDMIKNRFSLVHTFSTLAMM